MSNTQQHIIQEAKRVLGQLNDVYEALASARDDVGLESLGRGGGDERTAGLSPVDKAVAEEKAQVLNRGLRGLEKLLSHREADITAEEGFGLEAIIQLEGRPAILIQEGDFIEPPKKWQHLKAVRAKIQASIERVGRIEVSGHPSLEWIGTGFLVGSNIVMTNRHVAQEFSKTSNGAWSFRAGMASRIDFREEFGSTQSLEFRIAGIIGIHEEYDMALLKVEEKADGHSLPAPLQVEAVGPTMLEGRQVYVIGYPAWDGRRNDPEPMRKIFTDIYNVKRLQPGETTGGDIGQRQFYYDCSTLGGNSGSPVIDLESHRVIGLHFGGRYLERNYAVALWTLTDDPLVKKGRINFA